MVSEHGPSGPAKQNNKQEDFSLPTQWRVQDFLDGRSYDELIEETQGYVEKGKETLGQLDPTMSQELFGSALETYSEIWRRVYALAYYPHARNLVNITPKGEEAPQDLHTKMSETQKEAHAIYSQIHAWLQGKKLPDHAELDTNNQERLFAGSGVWRNYLEELAQASGAHALDPERERQLLEQHSQVQAKQRADRAEIEGSAIGMLRGQFSSPDPETRAQAYQTFLKTYEDSAPLFAEHFNTTMKIWVENSQAHKFPHPITKRNWENGVSDEVVQNILSTFEANAHLFHSFFDAKGRYLGQEKLDRNDLYAPIKREASEKQPYAQSLVELQDFCKTVHPGLSELLSRLAHNGHIDVEPRDGKRTVPMTAPTLFDTDPFILLNFDGGPQATEHFAHELGHAWHLDSTRELPYVLQKPSRFVNEIFSNFLQKLYREHARASKPAEGQGNITELHDRIMGIFHGGMRQVHFTLFQNKVFEKYQTTGQEATLDELKQDYRALLNQQFGPGVEVDNSFDYEWASDQTMMNTPFDNYIYAAGDFFSEILTAQYKEDPEGCIERLQDAMVAGGSVSPETILEKLGITIDDPTIWSRGFEEVRKDIAHFSEHVEKFTNPS